MINKIKSFILNSNLFILETLTLVGILTFTILYNIYR